MWYKPGVANCSYEESESKSLDFLRHTASVAMTQLHHWSANAATDETNKWARLYPQKTLFTKQVLNSAISTSFYESVI